MGQDESTPTLLTALHFQQAVERVCIALDECVPGWHTKARARARVMMRKLDDGYHEHDRHRALRRMVQEHHYQDLRMYTGRKARGFTRQIEGDRIHLFNFDVLTLEHYRANDLSDRFNEGAVAYWQHYAASCLLHEIEKRNEQ